MSDPGNLNALLGGLSAVRLGQQLSHPPTHHAQQPHRLPSALASHIPGPAPESYTDPIAADTVMQGSEQDDAALSHYEQLVSEMEREIAELEAQLPAGIKAGEIHPGMLDIEFSTPTPPQLLKTWTPSGVHTLPWALIKEYSRGKYGFAVWPVLTPPSSEYQYRAAFSSGEEHVLDFALWFIAKLESRGPLRLRARYHGREYDLKQLSEFLSQRSVV